MYTIQFSMIYYTNNDKTCLLNLKFKLRLKQIKTILLEKIMNYKKTRSSLFYIGIECTSSLQGTGMFYYNDLSLK